MRDRRANTLLRRLPPAERRGRVSAVMLAAIARLPRRPGPQAHNPPAADLGLFMSLRAKYGDALARDMLRDHIARVERRRLRRVELDVP